MVRDQLDVIAEMLGRQSTKVEAMLCDAAEDLLALTGFPPGHWKKIWSTNPLERLDREVKGRTDVVGVFPNPEALLRLAGAAYWSKPTTNGKAPTAGTSPKPPWPYSPPHQGRSSRPRTHDGII